MDYVWYDPGVWHFSIYDHIGIDEIISSYKQAYAELGFKFENQVAQKGSRSCIVHLLGYRK
jgi:hypothetical protein